MARPRQGPGRQLAHGLRDGRQPILEGGKIEQVGFEAACLVTCDRLLEMVPSDGEIIEGVASETSRRSLANLLPSFVKLEADRVPRTGGTRVLSDQVSGRPVESRRDFLDRMIALVEGAERQIDTQRDCTEYSFGRSDHHLFAGCCDLEPLRSTLARRRLCLFVSLLVCLIPTTIGGLLSAIGIAGMDR